MRKRKTYRSPNAEIKGVYRKLKVGEIVKEGDFVAHVPDPEWMWVSESIGKRVKVEYRYVGSYQYIITYYRRIHKKF